MKAVSFLTACILLVCFSVSFGQSPLDKGNYQLGGSVSFNHSKTNNDYFDDESTIIQLSPQYSYFLIDNLLIGGQFSFTYSEYEWTDPASYKYFSRSLGFGPTVKYYFRTNNLIPFISASASYNKYLADDEFGYNFNFSAGLDFFIAKSLALEPFISYEIVNNFKPDSDQNSISFGIRLNYFIIQ